MLLEAGLSLGGSQCRGSNGLVMCQAGVLKFSPALFILSFSSNPESLFFFFFPLRYVRYFYWLHLNFYLNSDLGQAPLPLSKLNLLTSKTNTYLKGFFFAVERKYIDEVHGM